MKRNRSTLPRQNNSGIKSRNITLVGGYFDGKIVEFFRDGRTGIHWQSGIVLGVYRCDAYSLDPTNPTKANLVCEESVEHAF